MNGPIYDAAGNVIQDALNNYLYDAKGRLCAVENILAGTTTEYVYDADSRRVAKGSWAVSGWPAAGATWQGATPNCSAPTAANGFTLQALYLRGGAGDQDVEIDPAQGSNPAGWHQNVFANGGLLATYTQLGTASPALYFNFNDWLGTKRLEVNAAGQAVNYWGSDPFGDYLTPHVTTPDPSEHHLTGKERDTESGNDYFGARHYASSTARFLSPDWSAKAEPVPYAKLDNPQSLNLYAYVGNNPLSRTDPTGHYEFRNSGCGDNAKCQKKWDKREDKFEKRREKDLKSKKADVRAAAAAYGARGEANGVHVGFADLLGSEHPANGATNPFGSTPGKIDIEVTIDNSRVGSDTQEHEGTHVKDDLKFLNSFDPKKGGYDQSLNPTHGQTEFDALKVGAEIDGGHNLNPNNPQQIWDFIRNSPDYGPVMDRPVFPPARFPGPSGPED